MSLYPDLSGFHLQSVGRPYTGAPADQESVNSAKTVVTQQAREQQSKTAEVANAQMSKTVAAIETTFTERFRALPALIRGIYVTLPEEIRDEFKKIQTAEELKKAIQKKFSENYWACHTSASSVSIQSLRRVEEIMNA